jgi:formate hydrogenlyase subunit 3/multisubunit Na+/H+ antiporter MnhD subunit
MPHYATEGTVFFLFGIFCAYWAQTTNRSAWLWFFLGLFFAPITGIFLVYKNSNDRAEAKSTTGA